MLFYSDYTRALTFQNLCLLLLLLLLLLSLPFLLLLQPRNARLSLGGGRECIVLVGELLHTPVYI